MFAYDEPPSEEESEASPLCCLGIPGAGGEDLDAAEELSPDAWIVRAYFLPATAAPAATAAVVVAVAEESEAIPEPEEEDFRLLPLPPLLLREKANMGGDFGAGGGSPGRDDFGGEDFLEVGLAGERSLTDGKTPSLNSSVLSDRPKTFHAAGDADCDFTAAASAMIEEESGGAGGALIDGNVPLVISDSKLVVLCSFSSGSRWSSGGWRLASSEPDPKIQPSVPGMIIMMRCDGSCRVLSRNKSACDTWICPAGSESYNRKMPSGLQRELWSGSLPLLAGLGSRRRWYVELLLQDFVIKLEF